MTPRPTTRIAVPDPQTQPLGPGRRPVGAPRAATIAVILAVVLLALGVLALRDALVAAGALDGTQLVAEVARGVDGTQASTWMLPVGVVVALVGLWFVVLALLPRRATEVQLAASVDVWLRPSDVARLASRTADDVPGVLRATSTATRRTVTVAAETTAQDTTEVRAAIAAAVGDRLAGLTPTPRVVVRARSAGGPR